MTLAPPQRLGQAPADGLLAPLRYWAEEAPDRPFLDLIADGPVRVHTYGDFYEKVRRLAAGLIDAGLRPGDRLVIHTGNSLGFLLSFFAVQEAGGVALPTIEQYSAAELAYVVRHAGAWGTVASKALIEVAGAAVEGTECRLFLEGEEAVGGVPTLESLLLDKAMAEESPSSRDAAVILYTSGTTSRPKGVMLSPAGTLFTAVSYANQLRLRSDDTVLSCMPLFHVNGMFLQLASTLVAGARLVLAPRFSASRYWSWIADHEVTVAHLIAGPIRVLLNGAGAGDRPPHRIRTMTYGLPLEDAELAEFEDRFAIPLCMVWGSTETCCGGTMMPIDFGARPGYQEIGPAMPGWEVGVVDDEFSPCPPGEVGELVVRSPGVMLGYFRDEAASEQTLRRGWVRTGDLGLCDEDGYFHFVDRIKDMLKPSGENVAASEIEQVLLAHPEVAECAVIGIPDPIRTERVVALIVGATGTEPNEESILDHCRKSLATFKVPSVVEFRGDLPKTSIGKIRKGELREELARRIAPEEFR